MTRRVIAGALGALVVSAAVAVAATPESGTVSKASPTLKWTGEVTGSYFNRVPILIGDLAGAPGDTVPCAQEGTTCDVFTLNVADSDDLVIGADAPDAEDSVTLRITKPDGEVVVSTGEVGGPGKPHKVKFPAAPVGEYTIEYFTFYTGTAAYTGIAELATPAPAPTEPGAAPPPPPTAPNPPPAVAFTIDAKVGKVSAKKANKTRKLSATVKPSRPVEKVVAQLRKGKTVVGSVTTGKFTGGKITLKLKKKLKKGAYTFVVEATDAAGTRVGKSIKVKVAK